MLWGQDKGSTASLGVKIGHLIKALWRPYLISDLKEDIVGDRWKNEDESYSTTYIQVSKETVGDFKYNWKKFSNWSIEFGGEKCSHKW